MLNNNNKLKVMNKTYSIITFIMSTLIFIACDTDVENLQVEGPIKRDQQYYDNLRAYKLTKHPVAFGWVGGWTANGPSEGNYLRAVPDSVDIIALWSDYQINTEAKEKDLRYVQNTLGTKVVFTIFAHEVPAPFEKTHDGIREFARAMADSVNKYSYDGLDLDYEPGYGGTGTLVSVSGFQDNMEVFVLELAKYLGPKSGTGKLLIIDGVPYAIKKELVDCFDYGVVQAYVCASYTNLQSRFNNAVSGGGYSWGGGWTPEKYIYAEDFEGGRHATGGVSHTLRDALPDGRISVPSLYGMALFVPVYNGAPAEMSGGFGSFHMEYDYRNADPYIFTRTAIQMVNPANPN